MDFIDEVTFSVEGGRGGDGCASFRREKFVPKGGPDGGDGGNGGRVVLRVNPGLTTLFDLERRKRYRAQSGGHGKGRKMYGKRGEDVVIQVPQGTVVKDVDSGLLLGDLTDEGIELVAASGGKGGRGNTHFATSTLQAPDFAENGTAGEHRNLKLELKLLADVGLVGLPNSGKSTLLARISAARPKIANYPFTTLVPNLGIVRHQPFKSFVAADIPGLIEGAHLGKGLGDRFLRHIQRTRILILLIEAGEPDIPQTYRVLTEELELFDHSLVEKPCFVTLSKIDLIPEEDRSRLPTRVGGKRVHFISGVTGEGVQNLMGAVAKKLEKEKIDRPV